MMRFTFLAVVAVLLVPQVVSAKRIEFDGMVTDFSHGLLGDTESLELPVAYTGWLEWDVLAEEMFFEFRVPSISNERSHTHPEEGDAEPFSFRSGNLYNPPRGVFGGSSEITESDESFIASSFGYSSFFDTRFRIDLNLPEQTGEWFVTQSCHVCTFIGFYGAHASVTSLALVVPEPNACLLLTLGVGWSAALLGSRRHTRHK